MYTKEFQRHIKKIKQWQLKPKHIKQQREKEIRQIYKRWREIVTENKALGYIKLVKPVRHGWFKEIIITHKVERYKNKAAILEVYDKVEKRFWGRTKEEANEHWFQQTSKYFIYKDFPTISKKQFNKLSFKAQCMCTPFYYKTERKKQKLRFYIKIPKGAYRVKYTRAYVTHSKRIDPALEREDALLDQQLLKSGYYNLAQKRWSWRHRHYWNKLVHKKEKQKTKVNLNALKAISIEDIINENILWEIN